MGRTRLDIGQYGTIHFTILDRRKVRARCKVRDVDGRVRDVTREGTSKADARSKLLAAVKDRPDFADGPVTAITTLERAVNTWLAELAEQVDRGNRAPNTWRAYRSAADKHVIPGLGGLRLREATTPRLDKFLTGMRSRHGVPVTRTARKILSGTLGWAVRQGAIPTNPVPDTSRLEGGGPQRLPRAMTPAEREQFITALERDNAAVLQDLPDLVRTMLATGVRIGEALALRFEDFDHSDKTLHVSGTVTRDTGRQLQRGRTKSAAGVRTLPLPGWAVDLLARRGDDLGWTGPIFPAVSGERYERDRKGGGWRDPKLASHHIRAAATRAGMPWLTSHVFRKTVATVLAESGATARDAADQLGHARPSLTQDVYFGRGTVASGNAVALEEMFPDASRP